MNKMKMNNLFKILKVSLIAIILICNTYIFSFNENQKITLGGLIKLSSANAENTNGYCKNFTKGVKRIYSHTTFHIVDTAPVWINHYINIDCCMDGTDMDYCNFGLEDSRCEGIVERNDPC